MNLDVPLINSKHTNPMAMLASSESEMNGDRSTECWALNFATSGEECDMPFVKKPKTIRDPLSHRIIEKRRRDRMNNCLSDLSRLIPTNYMKQGQGRIEKTEIIEMAIKHINNLTSVVNKRGSLKSSLPDRYLGFKECQDEVMRYLVEVEEWDVHDKLCSSLMSHLEQAGHKFRIMNDGSLSQSAKEEQYRHLEEDTSRQTTPLTMESIGQKHILEFEHTAMPVFPGPLPTVQHPAASSSQSSMDTAVPSATPFMGLEALASAQQVTQDQLKHDKHLWILLTAKYSEQNATVADSGLSTGTVSCISNKTSSDRDPSQCDDSNLYKVLQEPVPTCHDNSSSSVENGSYNNEFGVYKFKHNITKRFSEEEKKVMASDSSSWSSVSHGNKFKVKRKMRYNALNRSPCSLSTHYPNSDSSNNQGSNSSGENGQLPGFVLHPTGTHYVPLSIHPSDIVTDLFDKGNTSSPKVFHPVSIPVNFGGQLLYVKRVTEWKTESSERSLGSGSDGSHQGRLSVENLSGCNSENSPNPEQKTNKSSAF